MCANLIVPRFLRPVAHNIIHVIKLLETKETHDSLLKYVGEHLGIVAAGLISFGNGREQIAPVAREPVADRQFWKELAERLLKMASVVDIHRDSGSVYLLSPTGQQMINRVSRGRNAAVNQ